MGDGPPTPARGRKPGALTQGVRSISFRVRTIRACIAANCTQRARRRPGKMSEHVRTFPGRSGSERRSRAQYPQRRMNVHSGRTRCDSGCGLGCAQAYVSNAGSNACMDRPRAAAHVLDGVREPGGRRRDGESRAVSGQRPGSGTFRPGGCASGLAPGCSRPAPQAALPQNAEQCSELRLTVGFVRPTI